MKAEDPDRITHCAVTYPRWHLARAHLAGALLDSCRMMSSSSPYARYGSGPYSGAMFSVRRCLYFILLGK